MTRPRERPDLLRDPTLSNYREQLVEYALVTSLLEDAWFRRGQPMDVLRADLDVGGYDLVLRCNDIVRFVQMKSSASKAGSQTVHVALADPQISGCVIWCRLSAAQERPGLGMSFLVLGGPPGAPLGELGDEVAVNPRGKTPRHNHRVVKKACFQAQHSVSDLSDWLFGTLLG